MQVYIDITLLPGDDIGHHFLWEKLFQQVHLALVEHKDAEGKSPFGITFPEFNAEKNRLGRKLRIFAADQAAMDHLALPRWLERLSDYVHTTSIRSVPERIEQTVRYCRLQKKSNPERLIRRAARRQGVSVEEARAQRKDSNPQWTKAAYIWVTSLSSGERFRLFIRQETGGELEDGSHFTAYGLSCGTEGFLPHF